MNNTTNETIHNPQDYFELNNSVLYLKTEYQGPDNSWKLPESLEIPNNMDGTPVTSLAPGMFANNTRIKTIILPNSIETIPRNFCCLAVNLESVQSTDSIKYIEQQGFGGTRIKDIQFPNLRNMYDSAFLNCAYLETINIGQVTSIPFKAFMNCTRLREVTGGSQVTDIAPLAFARTHSLKTLAFLNQNTTVASGAFYCSGIDASSVPTDNAIPKAFHKFDNTANLEQDLDPPSCRNRLATKLSQNNDQWKDHTHLLNSSQTYGNSHAFFAVMHIHSAITGKYYDCPDDFVKELKSDPNLSKFLLEANRPEDFKNVASMFEALGHHTEVHGNCSALTPQNFHTLVNALQQGAYIFTEVPSLNQWIAKEYSTGHAVVIYGINSEKEVHVLDSYIVYEYFREGGFDPNIDVYTYTIPFKNLVGPNSRFVIVYPREKEPVVEWTGTAATDLFTEYSKPGEFPANEVISYPVVDGKGTPDGQNGIITVHRMGDYTYRTFVPHDRVALYMQMQGFDNDAKEYIWLEWMEFSPTRVVNNSIDGNNTTL